MMSEKQLKEKVIRLENELRVLKSILETPKDGKFGRPLGSTIYTDEQVEFLRDFKNTKMTALIKMFNNRFGTNFKKDSRALYNFMGRHRIIDIVKRSYEDE